MWMLAIKSFLKPVVSFCFGTPMASKISMVVIAFLLFGGMVWYFTHEYASVKLHNEQLTNANQVYAENEKRLHADLDAKDATIAMQTIETNNAISEQQELQGEIVKISEELKNEQKIFKRKSRTFQDMLDRRGEKIVTLANAVSDRMRDKWRRETDQIHDDLRKAASHLFTSTGTLEADIESD